MNGVKTALAGLQWVLGLVILIEAILFVMLSGRHDFAGTHMPNMIRLLLGWGEIIGSVLLLIRRTAVRGGWLLVGIFALAIVVHLLHGIFNVGVSRHLHCRGLYDCVCKIPKLHPL